MKNEFKAQLYDLKQAFGYEVKPNELRRLIEIENEGHKAAEDYCNGVLESEEYESLHSRLFREVSNILKVTDNSILFLNSDPRGYFLKIQDDYMRKNPDLDIQRDWGGYGIICPESVNPREEEE